MTRVTSSEFEADFALFSAKARHEPVVITTHGRDSLVVISADEWERLRQRDRRVGLASELGDEWVEAVKTAVVPAEFAYLDEESKER